MYKWDLAYIFEDSESKMILYVQNGCSNSDVKGLYLLFSNA